MKVAKNLVKNLFFSILSNTCWQQTFACQEKKNAFSKNKYLKTHDVFPGENRGTFKINDIFKNLKKMPEMQSQEWEASSYLVGMLCLRCC